MSQDDTTHVESHVTADVDTIRSWTETHTLVPVQRDHGEQRELDIVPESEVGDDQDQLEWPEFERVLGERDMLVVRSGDSPDDIQVLDRSAVISRATVENEAVERALMDGETVESEVTERRVVEQVVVEEATVESEVVDRELVESDIVDVELRATEVTQATVTRPEPPDESRTELTSFQPGGRVEDPYDVVITVEEEWELTRAVLERITIESTVVETDVEGTETVETGRMRETIDIEGVTETVLEGELVESPETAQAAVEHGHVESQFREDDVIETKLLRRQTIDEEMMVSKEITGQVADAETVSADAISHTVIESDIVDHDEYGVDLAATVAADSGHEPTADPEPAAGEPASGSPETAESTAADEDIRVTPREEDEGKTVVNPDGEAVGMVVDVDAGRLYVDPHPSVTDRIRTVLGWSDHDDDSYPLETDQIDHIDDQVVMRVEPETE